MARLIYSAFASLDGYIADAEGSFDWAAPDVEVHQFANDLMRPIGTHLYGRKLYEVMSFWETADADPDLPAVGRDFARVWQAADKVVYSRTLAEPMSERTRIEREFDADAVRAMKESASSELLIGGAGLAAESFRAGLVDDVHHVIVPVVVGGGTRALPDGVRLDLDLVDERRFANGFVHLHHRVRGT